jgi:hypothetical protein
MSGIAYYLVKLTEKTEETWEANTIYNIHWIRHVYEQTNNV